MYLFYQILQDRYLNYQVIRPLFFPINSFKFKNNTILIRTIYQSVGGVIMTINTTLKKKIDQQPEVANQQQIQFEGDYHQEDLLLLAKAWEIIEPQS